VITDRQRGPAMFGQVRRLFHSSTRPLPAATTGQPSSQRTGTRKVSRPRL
jgi:hypothetical protein